MQVSVTTRTANTKELYTIKEVCAGCGATAPDAQHQDRKVAQKRAERLAWDAGFVPRITGEWVCDRCRWKQLPPAMKERYPEWGNQYEPPLPMPEPAPEKPKRKSSKAKKDEVKA